MGNNLHNFHVAQHEEILEKINKIEIKNVDEKLLKKILTFSALELQNEILSNKKDLKKILDHFHYLKQIEQNKNFVLTDVFYKEPLERIQELEQLLSKDKISKKEYPLLGFFISVKESLRLKDCVSTHGFIVNMNNRITEQTKTIENFIAKGAIITSRGNVPQALFSMECYNHVYGRGLNPFDVNRVPGGSSGGEGALVRLGLVNASIGSDIAGSLRIPALFCGCVTLKPTVFRVSFDLLSDFFLHLDWGRNGPDFSSFMLPTIGPITRTVEDCEKMMEVLVNGIGVDAFSPPLKWNMDFELPKKVAVLKAFDYVEVSPANQRAVNETCEILRKKGFEIVELDLNDIFYDLFLNINAAYFKISLIRELARGKLPLGEPLIHDFTQFRRMHKIPKFLLGFVSGVFKKFGLERQRFFLEALKLSNEVNDSFILETRVQYAKEVIDRMEKLGVSSIISFGLATPAILHESFDNSAIQSIYTTIYNYFNFPVGVVPITKVREDEQDYPSKFNDVFSKSLKEIMKNSAGLPVGVQIASFPWREETCIKLMKIIEKEVKVDFRSSFQKQFD
jgi:fatty acid amide hydrolase